MMQLYLSKLLEEDTNYNCLKYMSFRVYIAEERKSMMQEEHKSSIVFKKKLLLNKYSDRENNI